MKEAEAPPSLYGSVACCTPCAANQLWRANAGIWPGGSVNSASDEGLQDSHISPSELTWNMIYPYMFPNTHANYIYSLYIIIKYSFNIIFIKYYIFSETAIIGKSLSCCSSLVCVLSRFSCVWLVVTLCIVAPPGSSVHGILQARTLEWVAMPSSKGSSQLRDWT